MSKHIDSTDVKQGALSKKHFPGNHTIKKEQTFLDQLLNRKYTSNPKINQFTLGKVYLESRNDRVAFRVFKDSDLNIQHQYQKKVNITTVDDDVLTTPSQIEHAKKQNMKDIVKRIYEKERWQLNPQKNQEEMEESLFNEQDPMTYYTQESDVVRTSNMTYTQ